MDTKKEFGLGTGKVVFKRFRTCFEFVQKCRGVTSSEKTTKKSAEVFWFFKGREFR